MPTKKQPVLSDFPSNVQDLILHEVLHADFGTRVDEVLGFWREKTLVHLRWKIWWRMLNELTDPAGGAYTCATIGSVWQRDRTTVMNGISHHAAIVGAASPLSASWVERKNAAYEASRIRYAADRRHLYPHLGLPHVRTPT